jgi:hypothetical protein
MGSKVPPTMANSLFTATIINPGRYEVLNKAIGKELQRLKAQKLPVRLEVHVDFH